MLKLLAFGDDFFFAFFRVSMFGNGGRKVGGVYKLMYAIMFAIMYGVMYCDCVLNVIICN